LSLLLQAWVLLGLLRLAWLLCGLLRRTSAPRSPGALPALTVLLPAHNEEQTLQGTVEALLASDHPNLRVLVVNDGSTDGTQALIHRLCADPRVEHLHLTPNRGKALALQAGLEQVQTPHVATVDADTYVSPTTLRSLSEALHGGADGVTAHVVVGAPRRVLTRLQAVEYLTALHIERRGLDGWHFHTTLPGATSAFQTGTVRQHGGFLSPTFVEDTDLTLRLQADGASLRYVARATSFTEAPQRLHDLWRQRVRWETGYLQVLRLRWPLHRGGASWIAWLHLFYGHVLSHAVPWIGIYLWTQGQLTFVLSSFLAWAALDLTIGLHALYREGTLRWWPWLMVQRTLWWPFNTLVFLRSLPRGLRTPPPTWQSPTRRGDALLPPQGQRS